MANVMVLGATGLVGRQVLDLLLATDRIEQVVAPTRRRIDRAHSRLVNPVMEMGGVDELIRTEKSLAGVICCLGTTIRQAGTKAAFRNVDYNFPLKAAKAAREVGCDYYSVVSAMGAAESSPFFYNRVKGELERDLQSLAFPYLTIVRPSLLLGERPNERRLLESVGGIGLKLLTPFMVRSLRHYRPIESLDVANCLVSDLLCYLNGLRDKGAKIILSGDIATS